MNTTRALSLALRTVPMAVALAATACGAASPTPQLKSAQQAYSSASAGPASAYAPDSLELARNSLSRAESANQSHDTAQRSFADLAQSRSEVADARGSLELARRHRDVALAQLTRAEGQAALRAAAECQGQQNRQGVTAMQGSSLLAQIADRQENVRGGTLYIISSGIEFQKNEATLTPGARHKLDQVANAIKSAPPNSMVEVEGFTDTTGGSAVNNPLSQRRAQVVAEYLQAQGVTESIRRRGLGESQPIGDNGTHQGRVQNRRAEVIIVNPR